MNKGRVFFYHYIFKKTKCPLNDDGSKICLPNCNRDVVAQPPSSGPCGGVWLLKAWCHRWLPRNQSENFHTRCLERILFINGPTEKHNDERPVPSTG